MSPADRIRCAAQANTCKETALVALQAAADWSASAGDYESYTRFHDLIACANRIVVYGVVKQREHAPNLGERWPLS